jgi:hypothetical protein
MRRTRRDIGGIRYKDKDGRPGPAVLVNRYKNFFALCQSLIWNVSLLVKYSPHDQEVGGIPDSGLSKEDTKKG